MAPSQKILRGTVTRISKDRSRIEWRDQDDKDHTLLLAVHTMRLLREHGLIDAPEGWTPDVGDSVFAVVDSREKPEPEQLLAPGAAVIEGVACHNWTAIALTALKRLAEEAEHGQALTGTFVLRGKVVAVEDDYQSYIGGGQAKDPDGWKVTWLDESGREHAQRANLSYYATGDAYQLDDEPNEFPEGFAPRVGSHVLAIADGSLWHALVIDEVPINNMTAFTRHQLRELAAGDTVHGMPLLETDRTAA
jgi:hypothetical protein